MADPILNKPSDPEQEYFAKEDLEKLKKLRAQADADRALQLAEQSRKQHWMKCPKCGGDLKETILRDLAIDVCQSCKGVWLDRGELDILVGGKSDSLLKRIAGAFRSDMQYGETIQDGVGDLPKK